MPSLKELLAARASAGGAAKSANVDLLGTPVPTGNCIIKTPEGPHYAKEVDASGKFVRWLPKPENTSAKSLKLSGALAKPIVLPSAPPLPADPEPRALGETTPGPDVPFEFASETNSEAEKLVTLARSALDTQLGVWIQPGETTDHAWLAVESHHVPGKLILLHRLPLLNKITGKEPF